MSPEIFKVNASFLTESGQPLTGPEYRVALRDEDLFFDDKLGKSSLDANGMAEFLVFTADILSIDSANERTPDLFFVVEKNGTEVFRSEVFDEVNFETENAATGRSQSLTRTFGPFTVAG